MRPINVTWLYIELFIARYTPLCSPFQFNARRFQLLLRVVVGVGR